MIDNPDHVERLLVKLQAALPLPARVTSELAATLQVSNSATKMLSTCSITWVSYAGDEGGIVCRLDFAQKLQSAAFASITHLRFDPRLPPARDIAACQKHRVKRLRLQPSLPPTAGQPGKNAVKKNPPWPRRGAYPRATDVWPSESGSPSCTPGRPHII